jgi:hypothetical protein
MKKDIGHINLWCLYNAKSVSESWFESSVGTIPDKFFKANKKECLAHWRQFYTSIYLKTKPVSKKIDGCSCEYESRQEPNSTRGNEKLRLWKCDVHKNIFKTYN